LERTVRFTLATAGDRPPRSNTFSAWPPPRGLAPCLQARIICRGEPDPDTGYFLNIRHIDEAFRNEGLPMLESALQDTPAADVDVGRLLPQLMTAIGPPLDQSVTQLTLDLSPYHGLTLRKSDMTQVLIHQTYEFSAAHRLHVPDYSDEQNREIFGKCNNPSGHGHNYRLEVTVAAPIREDEPTLNVGRLDQVVDREVIEVLDHKHLNRDVEAFADRNPSVEHIAETIYQMLEEPVTELPAELVKVRVWETGKTVCTYPAPD
ncbi:MAG: 6-carboxytetrahydropterin synthase, partial [Phycisphaeraceae bacterium]|nr:6-carboxytetrahydropterin synthase [Phycisphaeraceae bacterium]